MCCEADAVVGIVQVGDGSTTQRNSPIAVVGLSSGVAMVALGMVRLIQTFVVLCCTCACDLYRVLFESICTTKYRL
jgi:hypothetical protein